MASGIAETGVKTSIIVDDIESNNTENRPWVSDLVSIYPVNRTNHISDIFNRRKLLRSIKPSHIVHLGCSIKGLTTLNGLGTNVVAEWDEPRHLINTNFPRRLYYLTLRYWMLKRAKINVACTESLLSEGVYDEYIPHGNPLERETWTHPEKSDGPATYMGNLYPDWDHGLIIKALVKAATRNYHPKVRIIGGGLELDKWKRYAMEYNLKNLEFTGPVYGSAMVELLASSSILLYPAKDTPINRSRCSTKLFVYSAVNRPVLAHNVGEAQNILGGNMIAVKPAEDLISCLERYQNGELTTLNRPIPDNSYKDRSKRLLTLIQKL